MKLITYEKDFPFPQIKTRLVLHTYWIYSNRQFVIAAGHRGWILEKHYFRVCWQSSFGIIKLSTGIPHTVECLLGNN